MSLHLENLDDANIRDYMLEEVSSDVETDSIYLSPRLLPHAHDRYIQLLKEASKTGNSSSLAQSIDTNRILKTREGYRKRDGSRGEKNVPRTAHITMAEGEFNRFYLRAISRKAIEKGCKILAYRAKPVSSPRSSSAALIGTELDPAVLLKDLRENIGQNPILKMLGGPNSGISGRLIC